MSKIEIEVLKSKAALSAFATTWRRAATGKKTTPRLAFGSLRELFAAITEKRLELIRYVASHDVANIRQLAKELQRDYKNVHTDVTGLVELGLLEQDDSGRITAPFDEIVIHMPIRDAA